MKKILFMLVWSVLVTAGCNNAETIEEAFEQTMNEADAEYEIIEIAKDGRRGYVVYGQPTDEAEEIYLGDTVFSTAFVQKNEQNWQFIGGVVCDNEWGGTRIEEMDSYVYCGLITDESIEEVYVNGEETALVEVGDRHRVWYSLSKIDSSAKIKAIKTDGTEEWLKEM